MQHAVSQDERSMFLQNTVIGFHDCTVLQPGGHNVNTHGGWEK
jgi:hypothetical protein